MRLSLFAVAALFAASLGARADTVYTYTGQYFDIATGAYTTSDRVTGSFTVAAPLGVSLSNYSFVPESFTFYDGLQTLNSANTFYQTFNEFSTDANGVITGYQVVVATMNGSNSIRASTYVAGAGALDTGLNSPNLGFSTTPGAFTQQAASVAVTPEPSSLALLGTGMLGVFGVMRRRLAYLLR